MILNDFGHGLICWCVTLFVRVSYRDQVVEMNFSSIISDRFLKTISFPPSWVIYKKDALLMTYYHKTFTTCIKIQNKLQKRLQDRIFLVKISKLLKIPILENIWKRLLCLLKNFVRTLLILAMRKILFAC